jgi:A/G-specific adenine glycosylase
VKAPELNPPVEAFSRPSLHDAERHTLQQRLIGWFQAGHRDLPWRRTSDPYAIWVSEIMLQQTQVATVIPYFERFLERFPTVTALASAPLEEVLSLWKGLGYYARARNLHKGAVYVLQTHGGNFPTRLEEALQVPGVGRYTAGAILSIAFGQSVPLLDGNVARVYSRLLGCLLDTRTPAAQKTLWQVAERLIPSEQAGDFNQALMELGALVCTPTSPACARCPIQAGCYAATLPEPAVLPIRGESRARPSATALAVLVRRSTDGAALFGLRPAEGLLGGMWELPTILLPDDLEDDASLRLLSQTRLHGIPLRAVRETRVVHLFTHLELRLRLIEVEPVDGAELVLGVSPTVRSRGVGQLEVPYLEARWVDDQALPTLPLGRATQKGLEQLAEKLGESTRQLRLF